MPDEESRRQAVASLAEVSRNLENVTTLLTQVSRKSDRRNVRLWIVIAGFILDIALTIVLGVVLVGQVNQGNQLQQVQDRLHNDQLQACSLGNQFRVAQKQLWITLIALSKEGPQPSLTPAQQQQQQKILGEFIADLNTTYAQLNCSSIYSLAKS